MGDGDFSVELCGGCHVDRTGDIGLCTVVSERGVAAGVRRIEAVTGRGSVERLQERERLAEHLPGRYQTSFEQLPELLGKAGPEAVGSRGRGPQAQTPARLGRQRRQRDRERRRRESRFRRAGYRRCRRSELRNLADTLRQKLGSGVVVLGMESGGKATLLAAVTDDLTDRVKAGDLVRELAKTVGGRGGGKPNLAQAGGPDVEKARRRSDAGRPRVVAAAGGRQRKLRNRLPTPADCDRKGDLK